MSGYAASVFVGRMEHSETLRKPSLGHWGSARLVRWRESAASLSAHLSAEEIIHAQGDGFRYLTLTTSGALAALIRDTLENTPIVNGLVRDRDSLRISYADWRGDEAFQEHFGALLKALEALGDEALVTIEEIDQS